MEMRSWLQSPSSLTHGNIIKREIFSKKDPDDPHKPGAILNHIDSFSRCYLESRIASIPTSFDDRQLIFYIVDGEAIFEGGDLKQEVREGDGIIVPPGTTHVLNNEANTTPLEFSDIGRNPCRCSRNTPRRCTYQKLPGATPESRALDPSRPPHLRRG